MVVRSDAGSGGSRRSMRSLLNWRPSLRMVGWLLPLRGAAAGSEEKLPSCSLLLLLLWLFSLAVVVVFSGLWSFNRGGNGVL